MGPRAGSTSTLKYEKMAGRPAGGGVLVNNSNQSINEATFAYSQRFP